MTERGEEEGASGSPWGLYLGLLLMLAAGGALGGGIAWALTDREDGIGPAEVRAARAAGSASVDVGAASASAYTRGEAAGFAGGEAVGTAQLASFRTTYSTPEVTRWPPSAAKPPPSRGRRLRRPPTSTPAPLRIAPAPGASPMETVTATTPDTWPGATPLVSPAFLSRCRQANARSINAA